MIVPNTEPFLSDIEEPSHTFFKHPIWYKLFANHKTILQYYTSYPAIKHLQKEVLFDTKGQYMKDSIQNLGPGQGGGLKSLFTPN